MRRPTAITTLILFALCLAAIAPAQQAETTRKLTSSRPPTYPALARGMNLEGTVKLRVTVAPSGVAKSSEVLGGNAIFSKAAQDAVAGWKWAPASEDTQVLINLSFHP